MSTIKKYDLDKVLNELREQGFESICIWNPAYNVGGGGIIYNKISRWILENTELKVYWMDYKDGYEQTIEHKNFIRLNYTDKDINFPVKEKCLILVNSTRVIQLKNMNPENKVLFWHWETTRTGWESVFINGEEKKFLELVRDNHAMIYHDWSAMHVLNYYQKIGFNEKKYLNLTVHPKKKECYGNFIKKNELNIVFLSRLAPDKIQSLFYLIRQLAIYNCNKKLVLHVVGDGKSRGVVENFCKEYEKKLSIILHGTVPHEELDDFLLSHADILFAVGTSVLEGAALKIPSVACIMNNKPFEEDEAFWLYNSKEYTVGISTEQKKDFNVSYTKILTILDSILAPNGKPIHGEKCYQYYLNNHSNLGETVYNILTYFKDSSLTFKKIAKCIRYIPYNCTTKHCINIFRIIKFVFMKHPTRGDFSLFGIPILKIKNKNKKIKYYFLGIHVATRKTSIPYRFPSTLHRDIRK